MNYETILEITDHPRDPFIQLARTPAGWYVVVYNFVGGENLPSFPDHLLAGPFASQEEAEGWEVPEVLTTPVVFRSGACIAGEHDDCRGADRGCDCPCHQSGKAARDAAILTEEELGLLVDLEKEIALRPYIQSLLSTGGSQPPDPPYWRELQEQKTINAQLRAACHAALSLIEVDIERYGQHTTEEGDMLRAAIALAEGSE